MTTTPEAAPQEPKNRDLSPTQNFRIRKWPCDGKPRYKTVGLRSRESQTYSEAYESIFLLTGGKYNEGDMTGAKGRVHTREGIRRLSALNRLYMLSAEKFITAAIAAENYQIQVALANAKAVTKPEPETKEPDETIPKEGAGSSPVS